MNEYRAKIVKYLGRFIPGRTALDDEDLFNSGFITSLTAMQLVAFVEREFAITIENEDLTRENFHTVNSLSGLVQRKLAPTTP